MSAHLINYSINPFPGRWIVRGPGHFHLRLGPPELWLMTYWGF